MVEFKKTHATNELYLMEVNPKFWASHDLAIESGLNFAEKYLEIEENKPLTKKLNMELTYKIDKKFQWLARDLSSSLLRPLRFLRVIYTFLSFKAHNNLGNLLLKLGRLDNAEEEFLISTISHLVLT